LKKLFFYIPIGLGIIWLIVQHWPVTIHISGSTADKNFSITMPLKDKRRLDYFFRDVCFLHEWAYTLMGSKPMSIYDYLHPWAAIRRFFSHPHVGDMLSEAFWPPHFRLICYLFNPEQLKLKLGWETLQAYMDRFPQDRFVFFSHLDREDRVGLVLIDKIKLVNVVKKHFPDFQEVLELLSIEPEELFHNKTLYLFVTSLNTDSMIGLVLGFGRENARLFEKYSKMDSDEWPLTFPWPEKGMAHLERLNEKMLSFQAWDISDLFYPPFACDPSTEETRQLKHAYEAEREQIIKYYQGKDVVEATLSLLYQ
jgi:hypothetical protein